MTEGYIPGDTAFLGSTLIVVLGETEEGIRIMEGKSVYLVDPEQIHKPSTLAEKLVILFWANLMQFTTEELLFQIEELLKEVEA